MRACLVLLFVAYSASADTCSNTHKDEGVDMAVLAKV